MESVFSSITNWISGLWIPTSREKLQDAECKILERVKRPWEGYFVRVDADVEMWTLKVNFSPTEKPPIVLVHGFISGVCWWAENLDALSERHTVYAFDLPGFGRSSRPEFPTDADKVEEKFVQYIEEWRQVVGLEKFFLLGHSLGGYLVTAYALKYPERIEQLVLSDPWGFPILPYGLVDRHPHTPLDKGALPLWFYMGNYMFNSCNFLSPVRVCGPFGPWVTRLARYDTNKKESQLWKDPKMLDYIYHCNAQNPSGENAFRYLNFWLGWAKNPMIKRVKDLHPQISISIMYGSGTFFDHRTAYELKCLRPDSTVDTHIVQNAGHDIHVDNAGEFNRIMKRILNKVLSADVSEEEEEWTDVHAEDE